MDLREGCQKGGSLRVGSNPAPASKVRVFLLQGLQSPLLGFIGVMEKKMETTI